MKTDHNWQEYFSIAEQDKPFADKLADYSNIAMRQLDADRFYEFCDRHLGHLDEVAHEFFGGDILRDAIRQKVEALYPEHELDEFTELFWTRIQNWRETEGLA
jgi:hypothetical protein